MKTKVEEAMDVLKQAMKDDPDYAWSWHCNIAVMMQDVGVSHTVSNKGAANFMRLAFDVDTTKGKLFISFDANKTIPFRGCGGMIWDQTGKNADMLGRDDFGR